VSSTATAIPSGKYQQLSIGPVVGCGITTKGSLVCWGATIVPDETKFIQVVVGNDYVCALSSEQSVTCWGFGSKPAAYGEASPPNENFVQLAGGFYHACGLRSDGTAVCWGAGAYGRTADCEASGYDCGQAQAPADDRFVQLGAGMVHTCGLKADGTVKCWGAGVTSGTEASALKYGQATPPVDARFASISSGYLHNCGIRQSDGTVLCWGAGEANGSSSYDQHQSVPTDDHFLVLSAGLLQTCGLTTSYEIVCWGSATDGAPASVDGNWPLNPGH
jgi:alpha-tubulin suppressor-like RCC1 family protein